MFDEPLDANFRPTLPPPPDPVVPMGQAVVAPGRTVVANGTETAIAGYDTSGAPVYRPVRRPFGPGETVTLATSEIPALIAQGFLVAPVAGS